MPAATVEEAPSAAGDPNGPTMDETPPSGLAPKIATPGPGNPAYRKNFLLGWWAAPLHGVVGNTTATLYASAGSATQLDVTLFGDGGIGSGAPIASAKATVGRVPGPVTVNFGDIHASVDKELVLSVAIGNAGGTLLYDATTSPSSLSFSLDDYVPPPPILLPDPTEGWNPVGLVSDLKASRESSLAIDPTDEDNQLICDPSGVPNTTNGQSYFHLTADGGATWTTVDVESPGDLRRYAFEGGDCDVAFDADGTMYAADTWLGNLSIGHSTDHGATWDGTSLAVSSPIVDRPWLVGGPAGTIHVSYQDLQCCSPSAMWYTRSTDYGKTFSPAVPITTANEKGMQTWEGNFVVSPSGTDLYLVYTRRLFSLGVDGGPETVWVAASHDSGLTWTSNQVASMPNSASYLYPSIAMDSAGWLHVVFASRRTEDRPVFYSFSKDGVTWIPPVVVRAGVGAWAPWVDARAPGQAAIIWYGSTTPLATSAVDADWYFYWARVSGADTGSPVVTSEPTTVGPIFHGKAVMPEFNMVRLDSAGKMHIGASAYRGSGAAAGWAIYYQREW